MAIPRTFGKENEYGVYMTFKNGKPLVQDADGNSIPPKDGSASYVANYEQYVCLEARNWLIANDCVAVGQWLGNAARLYLDVGNHPEYSIGECSSLYDLIAHECFGDRLMSAAASRLNKQFSQYRLSIYRHAHDYLGHTLGHHINNMVRRSAWPDILDLHPAHIISRQIYTGSGALAAGPDDPYKGVIVSPRGLFIKGEAGPGTQDERDGPRCIINTRDEPWADEEKYRRVHDIAMDANVFQFANYLGVGVTALVLAMIEDGHLQKYRERIKLGEPVRAMRIVAKDTSLQAPLPLESGGTTTALKLQLVLLEAAKEYADKGGLSCFLPGEGKQLLEDWEQLLLDMENDIEKTRDRVLWVAKQRIFDRLNERSSSYNYLRAVEQRIEIVSAPSILQDKLHMQTLVDEQRIKAALLEPPNNWRAQVRGLSIASGLVGSADWDRLAFEPDLEVRVRMPEPNAGNPKSVAPMLRNATGAEDIKRKVGSVTIAYLQGERTVA